MSRLAVLAVLASIRPGRSLVMKHYIKTTYLTADNKVSADLLRISEEGFTMNTPLQEFTIIEMTLALRIKITTK